MQFFKHQSTMRHDPKVKRLVRRYKANGYAVYNWILESITEGIETESPLPILEDNISDLAYDLGIPESEIEEIVSYCVNNGLLQIISESGIVYCVKIYKYLNTSQTRSERLRQMIKAVSGKKDPNLLFADIRENIEKAILLEYKDLNSIPLLSETVYDNNDRKEEEKNRIEEEEEKKEKINKKENQPFKPYNPQNKLHDLLNDSITSWNNQPNLPKCRYQSINIPKIQDIIPKFDVFLYEEISKAIENLNSLWDQIDPRYRVSSFSNFFANDVIDSFVDDANPFQRYSKPFKESNMTQNEQRAMTRYYIYTDGKNCEDWNTLHEFMETDYFKNYLKEIEQDD